MTEPSNEVRATIIAALNNCPGVLHRQAALDWFTQEHAPALDANGLLPCPFCGGPARLYSFDTETDTWPVECDSRECDARIYGKDGPEQAIAQWNRRAPWQQSSGTVAPAPDSLARAAGGREAQRRLL